MFYFSKNLALRLFAKKNNKYYSSGKANQIKTKTTPPPTPPTKHTPGEINAFAKVNGESAAMLGSEIWARALPLTCTQALPNCTCCQHHSGVKGIDFGVKRTRILCESFPPLLGGTIPVALVVAVRAKQGLTPSGRCVCQWPLGQAQWALLMWPAASPRVFWKCMTWWALGKQGFEAVTGNRWREWMRLMEVFSPLSMPQLSFPYFFKTEEMYILLLTVNCFKNIRLSVW